MGRWQSGQLHQTVNLTPHGYVGSNPTLPRWYFCVPIVQWIEQQPSKLWIQVRSLVGIGCVSLGGINWYWKWVALWCWLLILLCIFLNYLLFSSRGLVVRTPPSHGGNRGFEPLRERFLYCYYNFVWSKKLLSPLEIIRIFEGRKKCFEVRIDLINQCLRILRQRWSM